MNRIKYLISVLFITSVLITGCSLNNLFGNDLGVGGDNMLDGPGMVRQWTIYDLYNDWVEITNDSNIKPYTLNVTADTCTLYYDGEEDTSFSYTIPEGISSYGAPEEDVYLEIEDCMKFENLIYHEEIMEDGRRVPILSGTVIELDGRGEVVIMEFVAEENKELLPEEFYSATYIRMNNASSRDTYVKE